MDNPIQRGAWERLAALPRGQRTMYICRTVCGEQALLENIKAAVREVMAEQGGGGFPAQKTEPETSSDGFGGAALDFLRALQREEA